MKRKALLYWSSGGCGIVLLTVAMYLLGIQWIVPVLLVLSLFLVVGAAVWGHIAGRFDSGGGVAVFPADVGFRLISKWGLRW